MIVEVIISDIGVVFKAGIPNQNTLVTRSDIKWKHVLCEIQLPEEQQEN
jgi:hypothetical protein